MYYDDFILIIIFSSKSLELINHTTIKYVLDEKQSANLCLQNTIHTKGINSLLLFPIKHIIHFKHTGRLSRNNFDSYIFLI